MNPTDTLVKSIFQKESLDDCSLEELQRIALQYPYFTPAQFLLANKLKTADENLYKEKMQTLSLHFNNLLWLDFLMNSNQVKALEEPEPGLENTELILEREKTTGHETVMNSESGIADPVNESHLWEASDDLNFLPSETHFVEERADQTGTPAAEFATEPETIEPTNEEIAASLNENVNVSGTETDFLGEKQEYSEPTLGETGAALMAVDSLNREITRSSDENVNVSDTEAPIVEEKQDYSEPPVDETAAASMAVEPASGEINESLDANPDFQEAETHIVKEEQDYAESPEEITGLGSEVQNELEEANDGLAMPVPLPDISQEPTETEIKFEPYHTVDYFASQGIRFVPEEKPADRFGQQLKSFTEWLKAMKRLPQAEVTKLSDLPSEEKVQELADHSVHEGEVLTESMAEVWRKQGNKEKAIEIYNKLSLLNPDKSAYFASLAEQLKES